MQSLLVWITAVVLPLVQNISGWMSTYGEDGFDKYEWRKLAQTILMTTPLHVAAVIGLSFVSADEWTLIVQTLMTFIFLVINKVKKTA